MRLGRWTRNRATRELVIPQLNEYQRFLAVRLRDAVLRAVNNLEPARIGWGLGHNDRQVFNRRWKMSPGSQALRNPFGGVDQVRMNPPRGDAALIEPAGPVEPQIHFHSVQHKLGGYETWRGTNLFEDNASTKIIDGILELLRHVARRE